MNLRTTNSKSSNLLNTIMSWLNVFSQQQEMYPIKYYKKNQYRRLPVKVPFKTL